MKAKITLESMENRNHDNKVQLDTFEKDRGLHDAYILMYKRGTCGYHGSDCSEHDNSSLLVQLNDDQRMKIQHCKDTHKLIKDLLQHEHKHVNKWNNLLHDQKIKIYVRM